MKHRRSLRGTVIGAIVGNASFRILSVLFTLLLVPVSLTSLGNTYFGVWMTIVSMTSMAAFSDLGVGNGLMTKLSQAFALKDFHSASKLIVSAFFILSLIGAVFTALGILVGTGLADGLLATLIPDAPVEATKIMVLTAAITFGFRLPLSVSQRVQIAQQRVAIASAWLAATNAAAWLIALVAAHFDFGPVLFVVLVLAAPVLIQLLHFTTVLYSLRAMNISILQLPSKRAIQNLVSIGFLFFLVSIGTSLSLNLDNPLISATRGAEHVAHYSIVARAFSFINLLVALVTLPLWPRISAAFVAGQFTWIHIIVRRTLFALLIVTGLGSAFLALNLNAIIDIWIGEQLGISLLMASGFASTSILLAIASPYFTVQNGTGHIRLQPVGWAAFLVTSALLKWTALVMDYSLDVLPWITAALYLGILMPTALIGSRQALRHHQQRAVERIVEYTGNS